MGLSLSRSLSKPSETVHQLAAKKAVQDLEEGRAWIFDARDQEGVLIECRFPSQFDDLEKKEAVRLGETYQIAGKWCSFVAVSDGEIADVEMDTQVVHQDLKVKAFETLAGKHSWGVYSGRCKMAFGDDADFFSRGSEDDEDLDFSGIVVESMCVFSAGFVQMACSAPIGASRDEGSEDDEDLDFSEIVRQSMMDEDEVELVEGSDDAYMYEECCVAVSSVSSVSARRRCSSRFISGNFSQQQ